MPWCPKCKLEYVKGINVCPDCNEELVEELGKEVDESVNFDFEKVEYETNDAASVMYMRELGMDEEHAAIMENLIKAKQVPVYRSKEDALNEHKSGAGVLLVCGVAGIAALVLNFLGVLSLPLYGFSLYLMSAVMGSLFLVFLLCGIRSVIRIKELTPEVEEEKKLIDDCVAYIKMKKERGDYTFENPDNFEEEFLALSEKIVDDISVAFPQAERGFANYVADRYLSDIFDEN